MSKSFKEKVLDLRTAESKYIVEMRKRTRGTGLKIVTVQLGAIFALVGQLEASLVVRIIFLNNHHVNVASRSEIVEDTCLDGFSDQLNGFISLGQLVINSIR